MAEQSNAQQPVNTREHYFAWLVVAGCFLVSGFAALLYQTIWMRQFGIVFGTSEMAIVATLASYMAGLGSGAYFAQKFVERIRRPVLTYAVLEAGIGVCALAVPYLIAGSGTLLSRLVTLGLIDTHEPAAGVVMAYFLLTFLLLMLPTLMMGATLPILLRFAVRTDAEVGRRTSLLYALNTIGAVAGVITTAFLFLPRMDLSQIINIGVGLNFLAAACAALLREPVRSQLANTVTYQSGSTVTRPVTLMAVMALSGVVSFCLEVTWTRLLGHVAGGSVYAFAVMLATFLSGIAVGSMLASRFAQRQEQALTALGWVQIGIAVCSTATYVFIGRLLPEERSWSAILLMSGSVMLPATLLIGATFPLAVRAAVNRPEDTAIIAGRIYAANTVGAIVGAILTGFVLLPLLGFTLTVKSASTLSLILAGVIFFIGGVRKPSFTAVPMSLVVILLLLP